VVVAEAAMPRSRLHKYFDWNDESAGTKFRLSQARKYVQAVYIFVSVQGETFRTRGYESVRVEGEKFSQRCYVSSVRVFSTPELADQILARALKEIKLWRMKYKRFAQLVEIFQAIGLVEKKFKRRFAVAWSGKL
jgi:hypothetical protein